MTIDLDTAIAALIKGSIATPFEVLGIHPSPRGGYTVRAWVPGADEIQVARDGELVRMERIHVDGVFEARFPKASGEFPYHLRVDGGQPFEDPYRFGPVRTDAELERTRQPGGRVHELLGAHQTDLDGVAGTVFAVWAPAARAVSLIGDFNRWDPRRHPMRNRGPSGVWELFLPGVGNGELYKYRSLPGVGHTRIKADPCGRSMQVRPDTASVIVAPTDYAWGDDAWLRRRGGAAHRPLSIYEVHVGSWRRHPGARPREGYPGWKSYRELADELVGHAKELGFTHLELLPITEHPYDASWGYQTVGYFAPTSRYGTPDDLRYLVDRAHRQGVGVILDWVPAHFPRDDHGLARFDGTYLYEHADPRKGVHPDWGTHIFNYGRPEVVSFLVSSALYWIEEFHIDGLRLDAVASMLYLDYSREEGQWIPNEFGGRENIEAAQFLRQLNETLHEAHPDVLVMAEESTAWPGVTHPVRDGGLGFDLKWNMGWMNDTLEFVQSDPAVRKEVYEKLTFSLTYAFSERFLLPFSHDEVVHLKRSMLSKMPGDVLQQHAGLRLLYGYMWAHPGKKLLFMGGELGVWNEWDEEGELDWALAKEPLHAGLMRWVRALNELDATEAALHELDFDGRGFEWLDCHDTERTTLSFLRWSRDWGECIVVVCNFATVPWTEYRLAVPQAGRYRVLLDSCAAEFGGGDELEAQELGTREGSLFDREQYLELTLPPLSVIFLKRLS